MNLFETALGVDLPTVISTYSDCSFDVTKNRNTVCPICDHGHNTGCFGLYGKTKGVLDHFKCFSCGAHGDAIDFVMAIKGLASRSDAARDICNVFGLSYDLPKMPKGYKEYVDAMGFCATLFSLLLSSAPDPDYFVYRSLSPDVISKYKLGYCPSFFTNKDGKVISFRDLLKSRGYDDSFIDGLGLVNKNGDCVFAGRYIIPIHDGEGNVIAFSGRSLDPDAPKYINSPETSFFKKSFCLFNLPVAKAYPTVYVVEGYLDALSLISVGVPNVVAAMGTAFGPTHLNLLKGKKIILALDNDSAGRDHIASIIESFKDVPFLVLRDYPAKDFNEALCNGEPVYEFLFDYDPAPVFYIHHLAKSLDLSKQECRKELWIKVAKLIGADNPSYQKKFPINLAYTPFDFDFFWKRCIRYVKKVKAERGCN